MESVERVACLFARCPPVVRPPAPNDMDNGIRFWSEWNRRTERGRDGWHGAMAGPKSEDNFSLSAFLLQLLAPPEGGRGEKADVPEHADPILILEILPYFQMGAEKPSPIR